MTVLCAMNEPGVGTWFASDSVISDADGYRMTNRQRKWLRGDGFAWGFSGCWSGFSAMGEQLHVVRPDWEPAKLFRFMRDTLIDYAFQPDEVRGKPLWFDMSSLFVTPDSVTRVEGDGTTITYGPGEFTARGSGTMIAEAAAWTMMRRDERPKDIVTEAVRAAIALDSHCGGELYVGLMSDRQVTEEIEGIPSHAALLAGVEKTTDELIASIRRK